jgi:hypothetical protein
VRLREIDVRLDRDHAARIDLAMGHVVVTPDVVEVDSLGHVPRRGRGPLWTNDLDALEEHGGI